MKNIIEGNHSCFYCNYKFEWEAELKVVPFQVRALPEVRADVYAIGQENGETQFEVVCKCPKCGLKNKFKHE